jgi:hypothetical protein
MLPRDFEAHPFSSRRLQYMSTSRFQPGPQLPEVQFCYIFLRSDVPCDYRSSLGRIWVSELYWVRWITVRYTQHLLLTDLLGTPDCMTPRMATIGRRNYASLRQKRRSLQLRIYFR